MSKVEKIRNTLALHFVDSTAILAESTPVLAFFETRIAGMSNQVSINARVLAAGLTYFAGTGYIYARGRDLSKRVFGVTDQTRERLQAIHDAAYLGAFNLVIAPLIYLASGARDIREIAVGTAAAIAFGLVNGGPMGYAVDVFRDLTGLKECRRLSYRVLKKQDARIKRALPALFVGAAIVVTAGIYAFRK